MRRPAASVRLRLIALCVGLFLGFCGSSGLLIYLIERMRDDHRAQAEQERRLAMIVDVDRSLAAYRHDSGKMNSARFAHDKAGEEEARSERDRAHEQLFVAIGKLATFDPESEQIIVDGVRNGTEQSERGVTAYLAGQEFQQALAKMQESFDTVEARLVEANRREKARTAEIEQSGEERSRLGLQLAMLITALTALAEIFLLLTVLRSIIRPLKYITAAIRQVNAGELALDLPPIGADEFGDMAQAVRHFRDRAEKLQRLAYQDSLTGLGNRALLGETVEAALEEAVGTNKAVAVLYLDLDRFRDVNERVGNWRADRYLCEIANRLSRFMPPSATLFRHGGDQFVVLVDEVVQGPTLSSFLQTAAENVQRGVAEPYTISGEVLMMSMGVGIAVAPEDGSSAEQLIGSAEAALNTAKREGRSKIRFAGGHQTAVARSRAALANDILRGLKAREFDLFYQPIVDYAQRKVVAAEALVRWRHPTRGLLNAFEFIEVAEEEGLIVRLGDECLRIAHERAREWLRKGLRVRIAVNLSARQLQEGHLLDSLRRQRLEDDPPGGLLDLELTESAMFDHSDSTRITLEEIKRLGYRLGLDDFGTGYSSLSYLQRLPIDKIKIDRQFVAQMEARSQTLAIVTATLTLAHALQLEVVAEGVESEAQAVMLVSLGCPLLQGFFFSRAIPAAEFETWVARFEGSAAIVREA